jgi:hypothetical protein
MTARDDLLAALLDERFGPPYEPYVSGKNTPAATQARRQALTAEERATRARRRGARLRAQRLAAAVVPTYDPDDGHAARLLDGVTKEPR